MKQETKFIIDMFKGKRKELLVIISIAVFGAVLAVIIPYIYGRLFDLAMISNTSLNLLFSLIFIWLILSLVSTYTSNKTGLRGEVLGLEVSLEAEANAYGHFLTLPILFHKKERRGEILQKISRGTWNLQGLIERVSDVFPQFLMLIFSIIAMFIIQWQLGLIILLSFMIYLVLTIKMMKPILKAREREQRIIEKQYGEVYNKLYNVFLVKNFAMEKKEKENFFQSLVEKTLPAMKRASERETMLSITQGIVYSISFVTVLGAAILFLRNGSITPGEFVMFFGYINLAFGPFRYFAGIYRFFKRSSIGIRRFLRLKAIAPESMKHGDRVLEKVKGEITFDKIDFGYLKDKKVLKKINLKISSGESVALVGKSGVGKTTLSELIIGYYKPSDGKILLDGVDISQLELKWLRDQIAIVPQDLSLLNDTLINNLRYAKPKAKFKEVVEAAKAASADEFIRKLPKGYRTIVGEDGVKLSMGQRQRIAITMAFLKDPKVLILDEPTSALDAESEEKVRKGIERLIKGKTTIIIAHRFSTVRNAGKIVVLDRGKIVELGNHRELMRKRGVYYKLYSLQKGLD